MYHREATLNYYRYYSKYIYSVSIVITYCNFNAKIFIISLM